MEDKICLIMYIFWKEGRNKRNWNGFELSSSKSCACPREDRKSPSFLAKVINEITQRHGFSGKLVFLDTMCFKSFCGPAILRCCF